jgi:hypothetical protein
MKKLLLSLIFLNAVILANAQMKWGGRIGANMNSRSGYNELSLKTGSIFTIQASVFEVQKLGKGFFFQPSLGYSGKGFKIRNWMFIDNLGNDEGTGDMNTRFDYIELGLPFLYQFPEAGGLEFGAGPYFACAIGGKNKATNFKPNGANKTPQLAPPDFKYNNRFDCGIILQVALRVSHQFLIILNYDQGFININKGGQMHSVNRSAGLSFGYLFSK